MQDEVGSDAGFGAESDKEVKVQDTSDTYSSATIDYSVSSIRPPPPEPEPVFSVSQPDLKFTSTEFIRKTTHVIHEPRKPMMSVFKIALAA